MVICWAIRSWASTIQLQGTNFKGYINHFWEANPEIIIDSSHFSEIDFKKLRTMGMNTVRYTMTWEMFEHNDTQ